MLYHRWLLKDEEGEEFMRKHFVLCILLFSLVVLGSIISGCFRTDIAFQQSIKSENTSQQSSVTVTTAQPSQIVNNSTVSVCRPPTLKKGWMFEFEQFATQNSNTCIGTGAPVFTAPKYPAGKIVNDTIVGKFYWWSKLGYCEFRNDSIWILYAWDNQPHYYPGTWVRLDKDHLIHGHEFSYRVEIVRPGKTGYPLTYNETVTFYFNPTEGRLYPYEFDGIHYADLEIWTTRFS
jgi:hypothetical protein